MTSYSSTTFSRILGGIGLALALSAGVPHAARAQGLPAETPANPTAASQPTTDTSTKKDAAPDETKEPAWKVAWRKQWAEQEAKKAAAARKAHPPATAPASAATGPLSASAPSASPAVTPSATPAKTKETVPPVAGTKAPTAPPPSTVLNETKADGPVETAPHPADKTLDSPFSTVGDAWKMLLYLVPTLLLIVGILAGVRRFQERNGRLPGPLQAAARRQTSRKGAPAGGGWIRSLLASFQQSSARERGGSSIRLVETVPMNGAYLHLVEVRGKLLLLGASGSGLSLLTELTDPNALATDDFRALLHAAASDLDTLDTDAGELPPAALVGTLEDGLRDTSDSLVRRARRLRTVQEEEEAFMQSGSQERRR